MGVLYTSLLKLNIGIWDYAVLRCPGRRGVGGQPPVVMRCDSLFTHAPCQTRVNTITAQLLLSITHTAEPDKSPHSTTDPDSERV